MKKAKKIEKMIDIALIVILSGVKNIMSIKSIAQKKITYYSITLCQKKQLNKQK